MKDPIERQAIINELESWLKVEGYSEGELNIIKAVLYELQSLPSAQPEPCGEVVSREVLVKFFDDWMSALDINCHHQSVADLMIIKGDIKNLPSAQSDLNEWCMDCKEYDKEKHSCPRFNRVIREALKDAKPERKTGKWNFIGDNMFECTSCGVVYTTEQLNGLRNYNTDQYAPKFCPNCGADMRGIWNDTT